MPGGAGRRANRLSLSPRHSASRQSLVPSLPGSSGTGGAGTHIAPFCPLGRGSGALKPARNVPGHEEEGGPEGGPAARGTPRSPVRRSPQPAADPTGAEPGALGVASRSYLVPGAEAAAPAAGAAAAAGPRRGCPSAGSARSERVSALLRRPVGSPFSPAAAAVIPAAWDRLGKSLQEPPARWASQRFNSAPARLIIQPASARQNRAVAAARRHEPCCFWYPAAPTRCKSDSLELGKLQILSVNLGPAWLILRRRSAATSLGSKGATNKGKAKQNKRNHLVEV